MPDSEPHGVSFAEATRTWARIAMLSFGGPVGQMATRVAINPFPRGLHDFSEDSGGRQ